MPSNSFTEPTLDGKSTEFSNTRNTAHASDPKRDASVTSRNNNTHNEDLRSANEQTNEHLVEQPDEGVRWRVQRYLDQFCEAMLDGNTKTLAAMWAIPAFVVDRKDTRVIQDRGEIERFFSGAPQMYHERGIVNTRALIEALDIIDEDLVMVNVRWPYIDESGRDIGSESSTYTLKANESGVFRMCVCTMRGETPSDEQH